MSLTIENQFTVRNINLETFDYPEPTVKTWTDLFGDGSKVSVAVDATPAEGSPIRLYKSPDVYRHDAKRYLQDAKYDIEEWMEDNKGNWLREIDRCARYVHDHNVKQLSEYTMAAVKSELLTSQVGHMIDNHELIEATK